MADAMAAAEADGGVDDERANALAEAIVRGASVPDQLVALVGRQDVTEMVLTMVLVASHPRLDSVVDVLGSMRRVAAEADPPRREVVEAYDSYLATLRMVQDARRKAQDPHRKAP